MVRLRVGEVVGFDKVVAVAKEAGLNEDIQPTPAVALGAYQVSPLKIAEAYTMFANGGVRVQPSFVSEVRDQSGTLLYHHQPETRRVLDPRVAFLMVDLLQEVMRSGTAAGVRSRGFKLPAGGAVRVDVDKASGLLAGPECSSTVASRYFIAGTEPAAQCAPLEVEIIPAADGGVLQRQVPAPAPPIEPIARQN